MHHRRTVNDPLKRLRDLKPGYNYRTHERTREDDYVNAYQGKVYSDPEMLYTGAHGALEMMTIAYDTLLANARSYDQELEKMLRDDREMADLAVGLLLRYDP